MSRRIINKDFNFDIFKIENSSDEFIYFEWYNIEIKNTYFKKDINLWNIDNKKYNIKFNNCIFEWKINFDLNWSIEFNNCIFKDKIYFSHYIKKIRSLNYYKCEFNKWIHLEYFSVWLLSFYENKWDININNIVSWDFFIVSIWEYSISVSFLEITKNFSLGWNINRFLNKLELNYIKFFSDENISIVFQNIIVWELVLNNFLNYSKNFNFQNLVLEKFNIKNSDLWKTTFNWVSINKLYLENATLNDCIFNWVEFPKNYKLEEWKLSNKKLKDNYRQLKFVMDKNWNITEANKFFEKEMEYEMLSLWIDNSFWKWLYNLYKKKFIWKETKDLASGIQLWFGWSFNEFWNNWLRTLFLLFLWALISVIFNILYNYFFNIKIWDILFFWWWWIPQDFFHYDIIKDYFKLFLNLLYPLYWFKKDYIDWLDNWLTLGFIIYKTIYWILLWHLIVALKRTTKR